MAAGAQPLDGGGGGVEDGELASRPGRVRRERAAQGAGRAQLGVQHGEPRRFVERGVVRTDAGDGQQLGDDDLVHARVLAHVEARQVGAERLDRAAHRVDLGRRQRPGAVAVQRGAHDDQVADELVDRAVGRSRHGRRRDGEVGGEPRPEELDGHRVQAGEHAAQGAAVGLVGAERRLVAGCGGQRQQLGARRDEAVRDRQHPPQAAQCAEVVVEGGDRRPVGGRAQHVGGHERVAVAIAADPRSHAHGPGGVDIDAPPLRDEPFQVALERRDDLEQAGVVVAQRFVDLVGDAQLRHPQHRRLPQRQHEHAQPSIQLVALRRRRREIGADGKDRADVGEQVEHGLAADLGRVGGDHRHHEQVVDELADPVGVDPGGEQVVERRLDAAELGLAAVGAVVAAAPLVVHVLGRVGQQRQPPERPDQVQLLGDRAVGEGDGEAAERAATVAPGVDRPLAHALDQREHVGAGLLAHDLAEQPPEQPDVLAEGGVLPGLRHLPNVRPRPLPCAENPALCHRTSPRGLVR